jgi:hypothetical protein
VTLNGRYMTVVHKFGYLDVVFDRKLLWGAHMHYALYSAEMLKTTKLLAIHVRDFVRSTPRSDVDFVQGTDSFRFGVWLHSL